MEWSIHFCTLFLVIRPLFAANISDVTFRSTMTGILCYCDDCPRAKDEESEYCFLKPGGQCYSAAEAIYNQEKRAFETVRSFGCFSESDQAQLQCKGDLVPAYYGRSIKCCNYTDYCNKNLLPTYTPHGIDPTSGVSMENYVYIFASVVTILLFLGIVFIFFYLRNRYKKQDLSRRYLTKPYTLRLQKSQHILQDCISTTGSGAGKPLLVQTTISRQFRRDYCLGTGQFTELYVGDWNASKIVEKVFSTRSEDRWARERNIYETALLRYENVLGYIASDILKIGLRAIYTDYHKIGSLYNYLDKVCLNGPEFLALARSAANGIAQLHTEVLGTEKRPAVVHRDITSKNFLVNSNKECVISNFEIGLMHISTEDTLKDEPDLTLGTPRYMAPEVVNGSIDSLSFEAFKKADIYSLGLVFYEICQRFATVEGDNFQCEDHSLPFANVLPSCPNIDDMRVLHSMKKSKEDLLFIPVRWENDKLLKSFVAIMRECLYENPKSRPAALRIRKKIDSLSPTNIIR